MAKAAVGGGRPAISSSEKIKICTGSQFYARGISATNVPTNFLLEFSSTASVPRVDSLIVYVALK